MKSSIIFRNKYVLLIAVTACIFVACKKGKVFDFAGDETNRAFFNVENNTVKNYNSFAFSITHTLVATTGNDIKAEFPARVTQEAAEDIKLTYGVDNSMIAAYNAKNKVNYIAVPDGIVDLGTSQLTIPKGATISTDLLKFSIPRDKMPLLKEAGYLIPLKITSVNGAKNMEVSSNTSTVYVVITTTTINDLDRTKWIIHSFDSQEASGEGPNNGRAIFVLDGNLSTFWTSQWSGSEPPLPHNIAIDMVDVQNLSGLYLTSRQNAANGAPKGITVEISSNGTTWQNVGTYELQPINAKQTVAFSQKYSARYFKVTVTSTNGNTKSTFLAEVSAY